MRYLLTSLLCVLTLSLTAQMTGISIEVDTVFYGVDTPTPDDTFDVFGELDGYVTYKVYAEFTNPTDVLSALYSDVPALGTIPMQIDAPCGCYNPVSTSIAMDQTNNSEIWEIFPMWQYDSYFTIGMMSSDDLGILPQSVGLSSGTDICSSSITEGSMFVIGSPENTIAGDDLRILVAQVTTCGYWSFGANFQIFIEGDQNMTQLFEMPYSISVTEYEYSGCIDPSACNYDSEAINDDGSCLEYDECGVCGGSGIAEDECDCDGNVLDACGECGGNSGCLFCDEGTYWNVDTQTCLVDENYLEELLDTAYANGVESVICPEISSCPSDIDGNGEVGMSDLLIFLSSYGEVCEVISSPWMCGDLIEHEGYDYATVKIGEQCWFSENCRYLPEVSPSSANSDTSPYYYVYDYQGTDVEDAKTTSNYETYGVLYNWPAVMTEGICPTSWHIPSDEEFTELIDFLGGEEVAGGKMKDDVQWNGSNSSGWTGLPGGFLYFASVFVNNGNNGYWWSASEYDSYSWRYRLNSVDDGIIPGDLSQSYGYSARCIKD